MEEIVLDPSQFKLSLEDLAALQELISRSQSDGVQVGIPWNTKVYDYMFESGVEMDPSVILGDGYTILEEDEDII